MGTRMVVGSFSPSVVLRVARRRGHLADVRLAVDELPVTSSPAQFAALLDGTLDLALTSPDNVLAYRFSDRNPLGTRADARIVSAIDRGLGLALYGRPGLTEVGELQGASIGVDVPTSGFALAMYALTDALGLTRDSYETPALGSTPTRLDALLNGGCDATMLNAGNELVAEEAGCLALARVSEVCSPYLGTVLGVVGEAHLEGAYRLTDALRRTAAEIRADESAADVVAEARAALGLDEELARRYVERLRDPEEGLVLGDDDVMEALRTVVDLRRRHLPNVVDGRDVLDGALEPGQGLVVPPRNGRES